MTICGVKTGDRALLVLVWILTETMTVVGMRLETFIGVLFTGNTDFFKGWKF